MTVWPGQNATLECRGSSDLMISVVQWRKPDLKPDSYVFFYRKPHSYENYQHESFKGRVDLREPSMKDGDASVILRNVSISDTGTYECEIITSNTRSGERDVKEFKHSINLTVTDAGEFLFSLACVCVSLITFCCGQSPTVTMHVTRDTWI
uniref:Ig-like domain-containing protein n=1 Tax=Oreochromis niloticus TaxID=8128 RepID=A0A669E1D0_ORENI